MSAAVSWRDRIAVHQAAELFPMMDEAELRVLGNDIRKNGLKQPITFYAPHIRPDALQHGVKAVTLSINKEAVILSINIEKKKALCELELLDGRNRLAAMQLVGVLDDVRLGALLSCSLSRGRARFSVPRRRMAQAVWMRRAGDRT